MIMDILELELNKSILNNLGVIIFSKKSSRIALKIIAPKTQGNYYDTIPSICLRTYLKSKAYLMRIKIKIRIYSIMVFF